MLNSEFVGVDCVCNFEISCGSSQRSMCDFVYIRSFDDTTVILDNDVNRDDIIDALCNKDDEILCINMGVIRIDPSIQSDTEYYLQSLGAESVRDILDGVVKNYDMVKNFLKDGTCSFKTSAMIGLFDSPTNSNEQTINIAGFIDSSDNNIVYHSCIGTDEVIN